MKLHLEPYVRAALVAGTEGGVRADIDTVPAARAPRPQILTWFTSGSSWPNHITKTTMKAKAKLPVVDAAALESVEMGTGNVFADLGLSDPDDRRLRVQLATGLIELLEDDGMTQVAAAKHLDISQSHVSELKNYKLGRFSSESLLHFINQKHFRAVAAAGDVRKVLSILDRIDAAQ